MALPPGVTGDAAALRRERVLLQHDPDDVDCILDSLATALGKPPSFSLDIETTAHPTL